MPSWLDTRARAGEKRHDQRQGAGGQPEREQRIPMHLAAERTHCAMRDQREAG